MNKRVLETVRQRVPLESLDALCDSIVDCPHSTPAWKESGIRVIRNFNIVDGNLNFERGFFVDETEYSYRTRRAVPVADDIVISREAPMGIAAIIPAGLKACLGQRLVLLKVNRSKCDPMYLLGALSSKYVQVQFERADATGSTVSNLTIPQLRALKIPLLENHESIGRLLRIINDTTVTNIQILDHLATLLRLIYQYWFVQFDFPDQNGNPYRASGGLMTWNDQLKCEIPADWTVCQLGEVIEEGTKSSIPVKEAKQATGTYPFFTSGEAILQWHTPAAFGANILLNTGGNPDVKYYDGPMAYSTDTWCIHGDKVPTEYLYLLLEEIRPELDQKFFVGTGLKHLQKPLLKKRPIFLPNANVLSKFQEIVRPMLALQSQKQRENAALQELRDWLLPMLMNGQVTVDKGGKLSFFSH